MSPSERTAIAVVAATGAAVIAGGACLVGRMSGRAAPPVAVAPAAPRSAGAPARVAEPACDAREAMRARLRDRATGLEYVTVGMQVLRIANAGVGGIVEAAGWAASTSENGPPCRATFTYELNGMRRAVEFSYWPGPPARLATANQQAHDLADLADASMHMGRVATRVVPRAEQLEVATAMRIASAATAEDVYVDPDAADTLVVRRRHCVAGNVAFNAPPVVRVLRAARVRRVRCLADANWTIDIPPRGRVGEPYLPGAEPERPAPAVAAPAPAERHAPPRRPAAPAAAPEVRPMRVCYGTDGRRSIVPADQPCPSGGGLGPARREPAAARDAAWYEE